MLYEVITRPAVVLDQDNTPGLILSPGRITSYNVCYTKLLRAFSNIATWINYAASFGLTFFFSLYLQVVKGMSAQTAGFVLVVQPVIQAVLSRITSYNVCYTTLLRENLPAVYRQAFPIFPSFLRWYCHQTKPHHLWSGYGQSHAHPLLVRICFWSYNFV